MPLIKVSTKGSFFVGRCYYKRVKVSSQMPKPNGICIELTPTQFDYLYEMIMFGYEMEVPEQKGWDVQTYDNMVDNVTNGKSTILSEDVAGRL